MGKAAARSTTTNNEGGQKSTVSGLTIGLQMADTAWRVAVPILLLTLIGNKLDKAMGTNPLFKIVGLFLSLAIAGLLVYRQLQSAYPEFLQQDKKK